MPPIRAKSILRWAGIGLSLLAIFFVMGKFRDYGGEINFSLLSPDVLPLLGLSVVYGASNLLLAFAWKDLLLHFGLSVRKGWAIRVFGVSQLSKYIPGNIFHFVGRQAIGLEAGLPAWPLAKTAIWETGLLATTGCLFVILVIPYLFTGFPVIFSLFLFGVAVLLTAWILSNYFSRRIARVMGRYAIFLALTGLIFLAVLLQSVPTATVTGSAIILICGAYVVAWLAGFVTPGAPAGVGIREVVLYALLYTVVDEADLLTTIVLGRMVTVGGDVFFYLAALVAGEQKVQSV